MSELAFHSWLAGSFAESGKDMPGLAVGDAVLIHQTQRETMIICQPQQRNTAGRMFGGYLMRPEPLTACERRIPLM